MTFQMFCVAMKERLPKEKRMASIQYAYRQYRANPEVSLYKRIFIANVKSFFCLVHYLPLFCRPVADCPRVLYHTTEAAFWEDIKTQGLCNRKTGLVFLTDSLEFASDFAKKKRKPILISVDAERMLDAGFDLYLHDGNKAIFVTGAIPADFLTQEEFAYKVNAKDEG